MEDLFSPLPPPPSPDTATAALGPSSSFPFLPSSSSSPVLLTSASLASSLELYELHYQSLKKPPLKIDSILRRVNHIKKGDHTSRSRSSTQQRRLEDFISQEYHHHLFTLRQQGVFVYNPHTSTLKYNEVIYLLQNTSILFLEHLSNSTDIVHELVSYFHGKKLILCGGSLSAQNFHYFISFLLTREAPLTLHLDAIAIHFHHSLTQMSRCLSSNLCKMLFELSVDIESVGILGICSLLVSLKVPCPFLPPLIPPPLPSPPSSGQSLCSCLHHEDLLCLFLSPLHGRLLQDLSQELFSSCNRPLPLSSLSLL